MSGLSPAQLDAVCCELQRTQELIRQFARYMQASMQTRPAGGGVAPAQTEFPPSLGLDTSKLVKTEDLDELPGVLKRDSYMYDERGISAAVPQLYFDIVKALERPATSGFIVSDTQTIKIDINNKGVLVALNAGEKFTLSPFDPFRIEKLRITSASTTAGVRVFFI